jgi:hypothetical protein
MRTACFAIIACISCPAWSQSPPPPPSPEFRLATQLGLGMSGCRGPMRIVPVSGPTILPANRFGTYSSLTNPKGDAGSSANEWSRRIAASYGRPSYVVRPGNACRLKEAYVYATRNPFDGPVSISCLTSQGNAPNRLFVQLGQADRDTDCLKFPVRGELVVVSITESDSRVRVSGANYKFN